MPASSFLQARECGVLAAIAYEDVVSLIVVEPAEDMETAPAADVDAEAVVRNGANPMPTSSPPLCV
jgi:hypothetical protein